MKRLIILTFILAFSLVACSSQAGMNTQGKAQTLMRELKEVQTADEEKQTLIELWELSSGGIRNPDEPVVDLSLSVRDAMGNTGVNLLENGIEPLEVILTLRGEDWSELVIFTPLDVENVYVLMNE